MAATIIAKNPEKYGFFIEYHEPFLYEEVEISKMTSFKSIAKAAGVLISEIKIFNPELKKEITPPNYPHYRLKLPLGTKETFLANFSPGNEKGIDIRTIQKHRIRKGETISSIARRYDVSVRKLLEVNQLKKNSIIVAGHYLIIPLDN
jgi:membrane-bound lytic murein transglycosylase D